MCTYYITYGKIPHCTHCCDGCMFHEISEDDEEDNEIINVEFSKEELDMILQYQKESEATSIQNAISNAISLALDHTDDCK